MNYGELLKDPRWQKKRLIIMERDNWTCQVCQTTERTLNVHHLKYSGAPWEANDDHLTTLCEKCHHQEEEWKRLNPVFKELSNKGGVLITFLIDHAIAVAYSRFNDKNKWESLRNDLKEYNDKNCNSIYTWLK